MHFLLYNFNEHSSDEVIQNSIRNHNAYYLGIIPGNTHWRIQKFLLGAQNGKILSHYFSDVMMMTS